MPTTPVTLADLTSATLEGTGVFDTLMRSARSHLESEFKLGRIKGPEYATVYLGTMTEAMQTSVAFLLQKLKAAAEVDQVLAQTALLEQQKLNAITEGENLSKQGILLDKQALQAVAQTAQVEQQTTNLVAEALNIPKQGVVLDKQALQVEAQTALVTQQTANAVVEETVLVAQEAKLQAEILLTGLTGEKTTEEKLLLTQKTATELAQTRSTGVDDNSVVGKQKLLYAAQTDGFKSDAKQKAAKIMVDTWSVRRTTDEATVADSTNMLYDTAIGRAINTLLADVGA